MKHREIVSTLIREGVPPRIARQFPSLPESTLGLMIYGSQARGDAVVGSDLDVLALSPKIHSNIGSRDVSVSFYTSGQLKTGIGTLFGAHLKRDGKVIFDRTGELTEALDRMGSVDTDRVLSRSREMAQLFTTPYKDIPQYLPGLLRQARYLLRSSLYAQSIAEGVPSFSVRALAKKHGDPRLATLLASRQQAEPNLTDYADCLERLESIVGPFPVSTHGSLESTVVNEWGRPSDVLSMAFMALGTGSNGGDYAEVEKILL